MTIDIERLKTDAAYWNEVAPEGAELIIDRKRFVKWIGSTEYQCYLDDSGWAAREPSWSKSRYIEAGAFFDIIPRPTKPAEEWNGEGLPPAGSTQNECSIRGLSKTDSFEVVAHRDGKAIVYFTASPRTVTTTGPDDFRPIKTPEQRQREELAKLLNDFLFEGSGLLKPEDIADAILSRYNLEPK